MKNKVKPLYGFGTHRLKGDVCYKSVLYALKKGYNLIDTAEKYFNGEDIGRAMAKSKRKRSSYKIVHKLTDVLEFTRTSLETSLKIKTDMRELNTDYIDVMLMHGPSPRYHENPEIFQEGNINVWKTFQALKLQGKLKAIGVSNFNKEQIMYLIEATGVVPDYIEIEYNILNYKELRDFKYWLDNMGIKIIGYSPLAAGENWDAITHDNDYNTYIDNIDFIMEPEYALRFCLSHGVIPIPRSSNKKRIVENLKSLKKGVL